MKAVYQGGHHTVYCDGEVHIVTHGGYADSATDAGVENWKPPEIGESLAGRQEPEMRHRGRSTCDCANFAGQPNIR